MGCHWSHGRSASFGLRLLCILLVSSLLLPLTGCQIVSGEEVPNPQPQPPVLTGATGELLYITIDGDLTLLRPGTSSGPEATVLQRGLPAHTSWAWSPDGQAYALAIPRDGIDAHDILVYSVASGELLHETRGFPTFGLGAIEWPAKGPSFSLDTGTGFGRALDLFTLGQPDPVASIGYQGSYRWSPDAQVIAYCQPREIESPNLWELTEAGGSGDLAIYLVQTGETTTLIEGTAEYMYSPTAWLSADRLVVRRLASDPEAPDHVAYFECGLSDPPSLAPLEVMPYNLDRDFVVDLVPPDLRESCKRTGQYSWTADLSYVAVALRAVESGRFDVWVMSADGTEASKVADDCVGGTKALWRPGYLLVP